MDNKTSLPEFRYYSSWIIRSTDWSITFLKVQTTKSAYIREAVIYYHRHKGISPEEDDVMDHIRLVVQECNQQLLTELDKRIGSKDLIAYDKLKNIF